MTQHVGHRLEPQVLDVALPVAVQGQAQVLWAQSRMVRGGVLDWQMPLGVTGRTKSHRSPLALCRSWLLPHESHLGVGWGVTPVVGVGMGGQQSQAGTEGSRHLSLRWEHPHHAPHIPQKAEITAPVLEMGDGGTAKEQLTQSQGTHSLGVILPPCSPESKPRGLGTTGGWQGVTAPGAQGAASASQARTGRMPQGEEPQPVGSSGERRPLASAQYTSHRGKSGCHCVWQERR